MSRDLNEDSLVEAMNEIYWLSKNLGPIVFIEGQEEFARHWKNYTSTPLPIKPLPLNWPPYHDPHQRSLTKETP